MTGHSPPSRGAVAAWGLWDWAFSAFNAVATTFVFNTYLSGRAFGNPAHESELLGVFTAVAGVFIAVVAPVAGQRSDTSGRRKLWLGINSGVVVACLLGMVFVRNQPGYLSGTWRSGCPRPRCWCSASPRTSSPGSRRSRPAASMTGSGPSR